MNYISLDQSGDQILAFQGTLTAPRFIAAVHCNYEIANNQLLPVHESWDKIPNTESSSTRSTIPTGLTNGLDAI